MNDSTNEQTADLHKSQQAGRLFLPVGMALFNLVHSGELWVQEKTLGKSSGLAWGTRNLAGVPEYGGIALQAGVPEPKRATPLILLLTFARGRFRSGLCPTL